MDCGAQGYLIKPSDDGDLCQLVKLLVFGKEHSQANSLVGPRATTKWH